MLNLDSGEKIELYKHNVSFDDPPQEIKADADTETYSISAGSIAFCWIHRKGILFIILFSVKPILQNLIEFRFTTITITKQLKTTLYNKVF